MDISPGLSVWVIFMSIADAQNTVGTANKRMLCCSVPILMKLSAVDSLHDTTPPTVV